MSNVNKFLGCFCLVFSLDLVDARIFAITHRSEVHNSPIALHLAPMHPPPMFQCGPANGIVDCGCDQFQIIIGTVDEWGLGVNVFCFVLGLPFTPFASDDGIFDRPNFEFAFHLT
jgi:hypothetical protein